MCAFGMEREKWKKNTMSIINTCDTWDQLTIIIIDWLLLVLHYNLHSKWGWQALNVFQRLVYHILTGPLSCWKVEGSQKLKRTILMKSKLDEKPSQVKWWSERTMKPDRIAFVICVQCIEWLFFGCSSTDAHIDKFVMINEIKHCTSINKRSFELAQVHERP